MVAGEVVDAVRDCLACSRAGKIVVERLDGLLRVSLARTMKVAQLFFLFRVDADDGIAGGVVRVARARTGNDQEVGCTVRG